MEKRKGFTLIELLVVISIIALLMAILMPVLRRAKGAAQIAFCLSNVHNLSIAWFTYTIDNGGLLVGATNGTSDNSEPRGREFWYSWVTAPQDEAGHYLDYKTASFEDKLRGIRRGLLFPYVKNEKSYHCPADKRYLKPATHPDYQNTCGGYRSYSIAGCMNGTLWASHMTGMDKYHTCRIYSQIKAPAEKYVFVEDCDIRGFNINTWEISVTNPLWSKPVAIWHYDKSNLGFADGHAETHRWMDKRTIRLGQVRTQAELDSAIKVDQRGNPDLIYMQKHYAALRGAETD